MSDDSDDIARGDITPEQRAAMARLMSQIAGLDDTCVGVVMASISIDARTGKPSVRTLLTLGCEHVGEAREGSKAMIKALRKKIANLEEPEVHVIPGQTKDVH